jgi:hypothetical protein
MQQLPAVRHSHVAAWQACKPASHFISVRPKRMTRVVER